MNTLKTKFNLFFGTLILALLPLDSGASSISQPAHYSVAQNIDEAEVNSSIDLHLIADARDVTFVKSFYKVTGESSTSMYTQPKFDCVQIFSLVVGAMDWTVQGKTKFAIPVQIDLPYVYSKNVNDPAECDSSKIADRFSAIWTLSPTLIDGHTYYEEIQTPKGLLQLRLQDSTSFELEIAKTETGSYRLTSEIILPGFLTSQWTAYSPTLSASGSVVFKR